MALNRPVFRERFYGKRTSNIINVVLRLALAAKLSASFVCLLLRSNQFKNWVWDSVLH